MLFNSFCETSITLIPKPENIRKFSEHYVHTYKHGCTTNESRVSPMIYNTHRDHMGLFQKWKVGLTLEHQHNLSHYQNKGEKPSQ